VSVTGHRPTGPRDQDFPGIAASRTKTLVLWRQHALRTGCAPAVPLAANQEKPDASRDGRH
jgi:hypothetical protein